MAKFVGLILAAVAVFAVAGGGLPRLYGTGCEGRVFGFALAIEESDFQTNCKKIEPIPFLA